MFRIKRTKTAGGKKTAADPNPQPVTTVAYAAEVMPQGIVTGWSANPTGAVVLTAGAVQRIMDRYKGKPNVGTLEAEPVSASPEQLVKAVAVTDTIAAEEFAKLQSECRRLQARASELLSEIEQAHRAAEKGGAELRAALGRVSELETDVIVKMDRIAELETALAAAQQEQLATPEPPKQGRKK